ncbi:hypothetical protein GCM10027275_53990 [Rhabdobacter roseus]|uniref:Lipoprotein n=1 Tax=Rhabdobacter roseus TaxID=1655419 RepID=A0A840TTU2_9BACT|nr:hypothetical protein [Rhabdobacter roseus]MBB5287371.1 hypothetical protein [Rhabdobacter roseus]
MKKNLLYALGVLGLLSCQSNDLKPKDLRIHYQETATIDRTSQTTLTFADVDDGRCPEDVNCIWSGRAKVDLALRGAGASEPELIKLCLWCAGELNPGTSLPITDTLSYTYRGQNYLFTLKAVEPYPASHTAPTPKEDYSIVLSVQRK